MMHLNSSRRSLAERINLRAMLVPSPTIQAEVALLDAIAYLNRSGLDFVAVEAEGRVLGICSRARVSEILGTRYGYALHSRSKVADCLEGDFLQVGVDESIVPVLKRVFARDESYFWQDVVVLDTHGKYLGLLKAHALAKLQSRLLEEEVQHLEHRQEELEQASSQLRQANRELAEARDQGLQAVRAKSDFLAVMSHEIRTPLNGVLGMMTLLSESQLDLDQRDLLRAANDSAEALLLILNDILDFSRIEAGKFEIDLHRFDVRELAESVLVLMAESAQESGLEVICDIDPNVPKTIVSDSCRLRQILANLLGNAVKFTEEGQIALRIRCEELAGASCQLRIEVQDTGIGISEEAQKRLFQPFAQADSSTTRRYGGTGLGLAICSQLVKAMGGEVGLVSATGEGSTFWLTLQCDDCLQASERYAPREQPAGTVAFLCIENEEVGRVLERELTCRNFVVLKSGSPVLAAEAFLRGGKSVDLLVVDSHLWRLGVESIVGDLPTIVLYPSHGSELDKDSSGNRIHLCKPLRPSQIDRCVEALMGSAGGLMRGAEGTSYGEPAELRAEVCYEESPSVLVVEDNAVNRRLVSHFVRKWGYRCSQAEDGLEALELCETETFDVILLDCRMPRMDGYDFARRFREMELERGDGVRLPIIALTANALQGDRELCFAAGMDGYLTKPIKKQSLGEALKQALGSKSVSPCEKRDGEPDCNRSVKSRNLSLEKG